MLPCEYVQTREFLQMQQQVIRQFIRDEILRPLPDLFIESLMQVVPRGGRRLAVAKFRCEGRSRRSAEGGMRCDMVDFREGSKFISLHERFFTLIFQCMYEQNSEDRDK